MANISGMDEDIQNRQNASSTAIPPEFGEKGLENFGPLIVEISMWNHTHPSRLFQIIFRPPKGCCALKFSRPLENDNLTSPPPTGTGVRFTIFFKRGSKFGLKFSVFGSRSFEPRE